MWLCTAKDGSGNWHLATCDANGAQLMKLAQGTGTNTAKDGTGTDMSFLADADGNLFVREAKRDGANIIQLTADGQIKASGGVLHRIVVAGDGVTAGDTVTIKDGGSGGTVRLTVVFEATNQTIPVEVGAAFTTDIYVDVDITGGSVYVTGVYT